MKSRTLQYVRYLGTDQMSTRWAGDVVLSPRELEEGSILPFYPTGDPSFVVAVGLECESST